MAFHMTRWESDAVSVGKIYVELEEGNLGLALEISGHPTLCMKHSLIYMYTTHKQILLHQTHLAIITNVYTP